MREFLRSPIGHRLGYIDRGSAQDVARNMDGHLLGYFIHRRNQTTDSIGQVIGFGDLLAGLIHDANKGHR